MQIPRGSRPCIARRLINWFCCKSKGTTPPAPGCIAFHRRFDVPLLAWEFDHFLEYGITARVGQPMKPADDAACGRHFKASPNYWRANRRCSFIAITIRVISWSMDRIGIIDFQDALMGPGHVRSGIAVEGCLYRIG